MAIVVKFNVSGMTTEKYDDVLRRLEAAGAGSPPGRLYHVSYGPHDNLQVIDVFDSPQSLEAFGGNLEPILCEAGIAAVPEVLPGTESSTAEGPGREGREGTCLVPHPPRSLARRF